jgi:hypothetical protein
MEGTQVEEAKIGSVGELACQTYQSSSEKAERARLRNRRRSRGSVARLREDRNETTFALGAQRLRAADDEVHTEGIGCGPGEIPSPR